DELNPGRDVAPLVAATELHRAVVLIGEGHEVVRLQDLIAELRVRDTHLRPSHARAHRLSPDHRSQREVLADGEQERNDLEPGQPFGTVDDDGRPEAVEAEERADLALQALGPGGDLIHRMESAFPHLAARIPDQTGPAAYEHDRPMTGDL